MNTTFTQTIFLSVCIGLMLGSTLSIALNVRAIKEHTKIFTTYKTEMDELALDVWCKPSNNAQEQVNCIRENIYLKAK